MLKEKYDLVEEHLNTLESDYTRYDLVDMIEISYMLANKEEMNEFNKLLEFAFDGINSYGLFVKFVYDKFSKTNDLSLSEFLHNDNIKLIIQEFTEIYFEEVQ